MTSKEESPHSDKTLEESEEGYFLLFRKWREPILVLSVGHGTNEPLSVLEANDYAIQMIGYSREELTRMSLKDISNMASVDHARKAMKDSLVNGVGQFEIILIKKDGTEIPLEITAQLIELHGEKFILCVLSEMGELKRTETTLKETETRLETISKNMLDLISEVDMKGMFAYASPSHATVLGHQPNDLIGKSIFDFLHPVDADRMKAIVIDSIGKSEFGKLEVRFKHAHGYYIWLETIGKLRFDEKGFPISAILTSREITDRKKIETELKAERDFSSAVIDLAQTIVIVFDATGRIEKFNRASEIVTGYTSDDAVGKNFLELFASSLPEPNIDMGKKFFGEMLSGASSVHHESTWRKKDGSPLIVSWSAIAMMDDHQRVQHIIATGVDVTEHRLAEKSLRVRLALEGLLNRISASAVIVDDLDQFLDSTLKDLGETMEASRASILEFNVQKKTMTQVREWVAPGCPTDSHLWQDVPFATIPVDYDAMMSEEIVAFEDVERDHYDPILKEMLLKEDIKALLSVPITLGNKPFGIIGLDIIGHTREWRKEEVDLMIAIARIIGHVIEREKREELLEIKDTAIEMSINSILFADAAGKITYVNKAFLRGTGYKRKEEVIGKQITEFFPDSTDADRIVRNLQKEGFVVARAPISRADGSIIEVEITVTGVTDQRGNLQMIMGSAIDVKRLQGYLERK